MTREQAKQNLIAVGIENPTDEQVSAYLNQLQSETSKEKKRAEQYKADADKAAELQAKLDEINDANMSEVEKANKEVELANNKVSELEGQIKTMQLKTGLAEQGIIGEQAEKLIESMNSGSFDASILGQIIEEKQKSAVSEHEKKALKDTPNPDGGNDDLNKVSKAEKLVKSIYSDKGTKESVLSHYITKER